MGILEHTQTSYDWKCGREFDMYFCLGARLRGKQYVENTSPEWIKRMQREKHFWWRAYYKIRDYLSWLKLKLETIWRSDVYVPNPFKKEIWNLETDEYEEGTLFDKILFILRRCYFGIFR